jgi:hypothetical protein
MAKKKAAKTAKKAAKKASGAAAAGAPATETSSCTDQQLQAAGVLITAGEILAGLGDVVNAAVQAAVNQAVRGWLDARATANEQQATQQAAEKEAYVHSARTLILRTDSRRPYLRFLGRVAEILLRYRGFTTISAGTVYAVFLEEIPEHIPPEYRAPPTAGQDRSPTTNEGRRTFNTRMKDLRTAGFVRATAMKGNRPEDLVLTDCGAHVFDNWPDLQDIPGLALRGTVTPESWARRRTRRRS